MNLLYYSDFKDIGSAKKGYNIIDLEAGFRAPYIFIRRFFAYN